MAIHRNVDVVPEMGTLKKMGLLIGPFTAKPARHQAAVGPRRSGPSIEPRPEHMHAELG